MDRKRIAEAVDQMDREYPRASKLDRIIEYDLETWPARYPDGHENPGVYLFLDSNGQLLYIGKASCNECIGTRLGKYVQHDPDRRYRLCAGLNGDPYTARYILMVPVHSDHAFEAPAIEEFLISRLKPPVNKNGLSKS